MVIEEQCVSKSSDDRYRKALHVCLDRLTNESSNEPDIVAIRFFRIGVVLGRLGELSESIRCFNDAFILRDVAFERQIQNEGWRQFHDQQMATYILGKRNKYITSLAEGDMVHDLIKQRWKQLMQELEDSEFPFLGKDLPAWFQTIRIDFPWEIEDVEHLILNQGDQFDHDILLECVKSIH
jgi:hypothetical protein